MRTTDPFAPPPTNGAPPVFNDYPGAAAGYYPRLQHPAQPTAAGIGRRITLSAMMRYKWTTIALFLGLALPGALFAWFSHKPMYRSFATLEVPPIKDEIIERSKNNAMIPLYNAYLATRANEIRSPDVLNCVLDAPEVKNSRWFRERDTNFFGARLSNMERLRDQLQVKPQNQANFIQISMETENPEDCVTIVQTVQDQYRDWLGRKQREDNQTINSTRNTALEAERREVERLELQISEKRKALGITDPDTKLTGFESQQTKLQDELRAAMIEVEDMRSAIAELKKIRDGAPASQATSRPTAETANASLRYRTNARWRELDGRRRQEVSRLEDLRTRFGPAAPQIAKAEREIANIEQMLREEEQLIDEITEKGFAVGSGDDPVTAQINELDRLRRLAEAKIQRRKDDLSRMGIDSSKMVDEIGQLQKLQEDYNKHKALYDTLVSTKVQRELEQELPVIMPTDQSMAFRPTAPSNGNRRFLLVGMAAFAAALFSLGVTFLRVLMNPQVRETSDVLDATRGPMLGFVPLIPDLKKATPEQLAIQGEHFRMLRTALLERLPIERGSVLIITSAGPGAGKSTVSEKLSNTFAQCGKRVLVVDADLRRQTLTTRLGVRPSPGLLELLQKTTTESEAILTRGVGEPCVLPAGQLINAQSTEVLVGRAFRDFLQRMREKFDIVLLDAPPLLPVADARIMAQAADGALLIVREGHCRRHEVTHAMHLLSNATRRFLGTVFLGANRSSNYPSNYGAYYGEYAYTNPRPAGRDEIVAARKGNRFPS